MPSWGHWFKAVDFSPSSPFRCVSAWMHCIFTLNTRERLKMADVNDWKHLLQTQHWTADPAISMRVFRQSLISSCMSYSKSFVVSVYVLTLHCNCIVRRRQKLGRKFNIKHLLWDSSKRHIEVSIFLFQTFKFSRRKFGAHNFWRAGERERAAESER